VIKLTESKQVIVSNFQEFFYVFKEDINEEPKKEARIDIPFTKQAILGVKPTSDKMRDLIERKRVSKRWKQSFNYYCLHPEKFKFGFKDFK